MTPENLGVWKLICRTNSNLRGGMIAKYSVLEDCGKASSGQPMNGRKRLYYIAAVEQTWDYAPSGKDLIDGVNLADSEWVSSVLKYHKDSTITRAHDPGLFACVTTMKCYTVIAFWLGVSKGGARKLPRCQILNIRKSGKGLIPRFSMGDAGSGWWAPENHK